MAAKRAFKPPTFGSAEEERLHRKQRLAAAFRLFSRFGFDQGVAGHITARDPGTPTGSGSTRSACTLATLRSPT